MGISLIYGETGATNYDSQISFWTIIDLELLNNLIAFLILLSVI